MLDHGLMKSWGLRLRRRVPASPASAASASAEAWLARVLGGKAGIGNCSSKSRRRRKRRGELDGWRVDFQAPPSVASPVVSLRINSADEAQTWTPFNINRAGRPVIYFILSFFRVREVIVGGPDMHSRDR